MPELVDDYEPDKEASKKGFDYKELTQEQHRQALTEAFRQKSDLGYGELLTVLKQGYESIGYSYGRNKITALKVFLYNKRMIEQENKAYRFNPNFYY